MSRHWTGAERENVIRMFAHNFKEFGAKGVPTHTFTGIQNYLNQVPVGDFLTAVLENDLNHAVQFADAQNRRALPEIVDFMRYCMPRGVWGSPEKVRDWLS